VLKNNFVTLSFQSLLSVLLNVKTLMTNHCYYALKACIRLLYNSNDSNYGKVLFFCPNKYFSVLLCHLTSGGFFVNIFKWNTYMQSFLYKFDSEIFDKISNLNYKESQEERKCCQWNF